MQVLAVISLILIFTVNVEWKTIIIDILDKTAVKIIFAVNLCMTILISLLLIIGAVRVSNATIKYDRKNIRIERERDREKDIKYQAT